MINLYLNSTLEERDTQIQSLKKVFDENKLETDILLADFTEDREKL